MTDFSASSFILCDDTEAGFVLTLSVCENVSSRKKLGVDGDT